MDIVPTRGWTEERLGLVVKLVREGLSYSQIGQRLGVSRNAISGCAMRLRDTGRLPPLPAKIQARRTPPARAPRPLTAPPVARVANPLGHKATPSALKVGGDRVYPMPASQPLPASKAKAVDCSATMRPWEERGRGQCAWPIDGPNGAAWSCCRPAPDDKPVTYCADHRAIAFEPRPVDSKRRLMRDIRKYG